MLSAGNHTRNTDRTTLPRSDNAVRGNGLMLKGPKDDFSTDQTLNDLRPGKCGEPTFNGTHADDRPSNASKGGKNENVTPSLVLVRTHFCPVRMAGMVLGASDGNDKASACKY